MEIGGLIIIASYIAALALPILLWTVFVNVRLNNNGNNLKTRKVLLILAVVTTVASILFFIFASYVLNAFFTSDIVREETKIISFDNGDSFKITLTINKVWLESDDICYIAIFDAKHDIRCADISGRVSDSNKLIESWDNIELRINESDVVCYETPWCVIYRKNGENSFRSVTTKEYEDYKDYISIYERVKAVSE